MFEEDLRAVGTVPLTADSAMAAYRCGIFPMGLGEGGAPPLGWWAPVVRGVFLPGDLQVSRSLRRSERRFEFSHDRDLDAVVRACADPSREGAWITRDLHVLYRELFDRGHAHSVEVWSDGELVGGLFGIQTGSLFIGESMFHHRTDASKAALVHLVRLLDASGTDWMIDVQWATPHLVSLGLREISGYEYARRVEAAQVHGSSQVFSR